MALSTEEQLDQAVSLVAQLAREASGGSISRLTIDFQASGELPYSMAIPDQTLPMVGLAREADAPALDGEKRRTVAQSRTRGDS